MLQQVKLLFSVISFFLLTTAYAQGQFQFEKETHDFGIVEEGEQATYIFSFKNIGNQPIIMTNVKPSCGCTSPIWTKSPILPGTVGEIKVVYNSKGRLGTFNKSISISSNAALQSKTIYIKGVVEKPVEKVAHTAMEIKNSPKITLSKKEHFFGKIALGNPVVYTFIVKNEGKNPLTIGRVKAGCHCVTYTLSKQEIRAGDSAELQITYKPTTENPNTEDVLIIQSNDITTLYTQIKLKANVVKSLANDNMLFQNQGKGF